MNVRALATATALVTSVVLVLGAGPAAAAPSDPLDPGVRAWLEAEGPLRVGWALGIEPVAVWEEGDDAPTGGFSVDLWEIGAGALGIRVEHVSYGSIDAVVAALRDGEIDVAGTHAARPDLTSFARMSEPIAWAPVMLTAPRDLAARGEPRAGATVTTIGGSSLEQLVATHHPQLVYVPTETIVDGIERVVAGEIDYYFNGLSLIGWYAHELDLDLAPVGAAAEVLPIGSWTVPDTPAAAVADAVRGVVSDDQLALLHTTWTGFDLGDPAADTALPAWLLPAGGVLLALLVSTLLVVWLLRTKVREATAELAAANAGLEDVVAVRTGELGRTNERLRRSNGALRRFSEAVAHDLRGPLAAVYGMSATMGRLDGEQQRLFAERIADSTSRLLELVDHLLDDAVAVAAGATAIEDGAAFAAWLRGYLAPEAELAGATVEVDAPGGPIDADVAVLRRVAANLAGNALKHAHAPALAVHVRLARDAGGWSLVVDDNGQGLPAEHWPALFERGARLTTRTAGAGLGLHTVRTLVDAADGTVEVERSPAGGARFVVLLPATPGGDAPVAVRAGGARTHVERPAAR